MIHRCFLSKSPRKLTKAMGFLGSADPTMEVYSVLGAVRPAHEWDCRMIFSAKLGNYADLECWIKGCCSLVAICKLSFTDATDQFAINTNWIGTQMVVKEAMRAQNATTYGGQYSNRFDSSVSTRCPKTSPFYVSELKLITNEHGTGPMTLPILRRDYRLHRSSA
jgi:hypothetical protein